MLSMGKEISFSRLDLMLPSRGASEHTPAETRASPSGMAHPPSWCSAKSSKSI
ncbi:hypothetical protein F751_2959 [Auxenochlorella protothecoides]|uniref:Uncharacterized protein n=1 Tax=Auxenochlorella protothecoides TaxID=3075 RepID=A0A087SAL4_AUXPR|nr:hypothetical protein F751_2959 [Auxenochlorella protothecoides]KFM22768.1 hypothetical protein F751_2959 [Auxenochlorella protothecoides]